MKIMQQFMAALGAAILTAVLALGSLPVCAAQTGTLTIQAPDGYDGTFHVYKVADYVPATSTLTVVDPFTGCEQATTLTTNNLATEQAIREYGEALGAYCKTLENPSTVAGGSAVPAGTALSLDYGLYLVMQAQAGSGYYEILPFLTFLPQQTGAAADGIHASVNVEPKLEKIPETPPTPPVTPPVTPPETPPVTPPTTPPTTPPVTPPEEETPPEQETPPAPTEGIGDMEDGGNESGNMEDDGAYHESGGVMGDDSLIVTYAATAVLAAGALLWWFLRRARG